MRAHVKITPRKKGNTCGVIFMCARVSLTPVSLTKNGDLLVVYKKEVWVEEGLAQLVCARFSVWEVPRSIPRCDLKSLNS